MDIVLVVDACGAIVQSEGSHFRFVSEQDFAVRVLDDEVTVDLRRAVSMEMRWSLSHLLIHRNYHIWRYGICVCIVVFVVVVVVVAFIVVGPVVIIHDDVIVAATIHIAGLAVVFAAGGGF